MAPKRKMTVTLQLAESVRNSAWFLDSPYYEAATRNILSDEPDLSTLSIVFSEREIDALGFLYARQILRESRLVKFMWLLFPLSAKVPVDCVKDWVLAHNRLFNLVKTKRDVPQPTVPDTVQSFPQAIAALNGWESDDYNYIFYRDDESVKGRCDGIVQRVDSTDSTSLCYLQAPVVLQRCLIAKYAQSDGPVGMLDINQYVSKNMNSDQLVQHFFSRGGNSIETLRSILAPGSYIDVHGIFEIDVELIKKYGPGLITRFKVYSDFLNENVDVHSGLPTGTYVGDHCMLLVGVKGSGDSQMFLVQNWWCNKQFVQISRSYLLGCLPIVYFVHTPQTEIQNQYRLVYGCYAESGGVDAEDLDAPRLPLMDGLDTDSE